MRVWVRVIGKGLSRVHLWISLRTEPTDLRRSHPPAGEKLLIEKGEFRIRETSLLPAPVFLAIDRCVRGCRSFQSLVNASFSIPRDGYRMVLTNSGGPFEEPLACSYPLTSVALQSHILFPLLRSRYSEKSQDFLCQYRIWISRNSTFGWSCVKAGQSVPRNHEPQLV